MQSIVIEIPQEIAFQLRLPPKCAKQMIMQELVIRLFEQEIITSAQGAYLLKMDRLEFERFLAEHEIPIHGEADGLKEDINCLERVL
jgi:predicted HTH domain antitoxin